MRCQKNSNHNHHIHHIKPICKNHNIQNERITAIKYTNADSRRKWE